MCGLSQMKFSYTQKLYYKAIAKLLIGPAICFLLAFLLLSYATTQFVASTSTILGIIAFYAGYFLRPVLGRNLKVLDDKIDSIYSKHVADPLLKERDSAKRGMEGEATILTWLREICSPDEWSIISNCVLPGHKSDIDFILVGKKGIFVLEAKNYSEKLFFKSEEYGVIRNGKEIEHPAYQDPRQQVVWNAYRLEEFLDNEGIPGIKTKKALVFSEPDSFRFEGKPGVYLIDHKDALKKFIDSNPDDSMYTNDLCAQIVKILNE